MITNEFELPRNGLFGLMYLTELSAKWGIAIELLIYMLSRQFKGRLRKVRWSRNINLPYLGKGVVVYKPDTADYTTWRMTNTDAYRVMTKLENVLEDSQVYHELDVLNNAIIRNDYAIINRKRMLQYVNQCINIMGFVESVHQTEDVSLRQSYPKMIMLTDVYEISSKECIADKLFIRIPLVFARICDMLVREDMPIVVTGKVGYIKKKGHCEIVRVDSLRQARQDLVELLLM